MNIQFYALISFLLGKNVSIFNSLAKNSAERHIGSSKPERHWLLQSLDRWIAGEWYNTLCYTFSLVIKYFTPVYKYNKALYSVKFYLLFLNRDLPQSLQELGGWLNEQLVEFFVDYARLCFEKFGDRVKYFVTFNEPYVNVIKGYDLAVFAPGIKEPLESPYKAVHTMLKSHALTYQVYQKEFKDKQQGQIGISIDSSNYSPKDPNSQEDRDAADRAYQFRVFFK